MRQVSLDRSSPLARESIPKTAFPCPLGFSVPFFMETGTLAKSGARRKNRQDVARPFQ
jgi:hypothetical protein